MRAGIRADPPDGMARSVAGCQVHYARMVDRTGISQSCARKVTQMEWPLTVADRDVVIVREKVPGGQQFIVHSRRDPQFTCRTYVEAEARALSYAEQARAHVWFADAGGLQLVGTVPRPVSSPTRVTSA